MVSSNLVDWQKVDQSEFLHSGKFPIVDQGQNFIAGYTDHEEIVWGDDLPVVIFGDHTRILKYVDFPFVLGADGTKVLKPNKDILPLFAYYQLLSFDIPSAGYSRHFKFLKDFSFQYPSLTEQKRIASLLARADRLRQLRRTAHDLGDVLLQSVFLEMFEKQLKPNYPTTPMEDLVKITGGGTPSRDVPEYFEGNIPWLTSKDMRGDYIYDTQEHITEKAIRESATNLVPVGSILLVVKNKILMHRLPIAITKVPLCHGQDIKSIQCSNKVNSHFLVAVLKYNEANILFQARGANTEGLTLPMLNEIKVPNVPLSLQEEFAGVVARVESLRGRMGKSMRQVEGLSESVLHESFSQG